MMFIHPTDLTLSLFITDDLAPGARRRVAAHVGSCEKCFAYVAAMRSTAAIAAALPAPGASDDGIASFRARRSASERVLLPSATADEPRPARRVAWPIAAAAVLIIAAAVFSSAPELSAVAADSELMMSPAAPRAGDSVKVIYRPIPSLFPREDRLVLGASARTRHSQAYYRGVQEIVLDTLTRDGTGAFRGAFVLPDSVVFASLVLEDTAATVVDDRTGRPWELMVHGADGRPTFETLEQRQNHYMGRSWEEAYASARRKAELYPNQIRSWTELEFFEGQVLGKAAADSAASARLARVNELVAAYRVAQSVPSDELGELAFRAYAQKDTTAWDYWWERLRREAPNHSQTVQQATIRAFGKYPRNPDKWDERLLGDFEEIWRQHGPVSESGHVIFQAALSAAAQAKDFQAYRRWQHRRMVADPSVVHYAASGFLRFPELREEGLAILRRELMTARSDNRPAGRTRQAHARAIAAERRQLYAAIGRGLLESGNKRGALDTLALAVSDGWDLALLQQVAAARMATGDTVSALFLHAKIAADPRTSAVRRDSMAALGRRILGASVWADSVVGAGLFMGKTLLTASRLRFVTGEPEVLDNAGQTMKLRDLTANKPALVVFWSRFCGPALEALPRIDSVATVLRSQGVPAFLVVDEPPSAELTAFLKKHKVASPVYHDKRREAANAFRNFGTPAYYVLDPAGRIRFTWASTEDELLVQIAAVRGERTSGAAAGM